MLESFRIHKPEPDLIPRNANTVYYSHSKLENQSTCPAKNYFGALAKDKKIPLDPAYALVYGSGAHKGIEDRLTGKTTDGYRTAMEYVQENLLDIFKGEKIDMATVLAKQELVKRCMTNFEEQHYGTLMWEMQRRGLDPADCVEVKLQMPYREGIFTGVVDLLIPNGAWGDWKTGSRIPQHRSILSGPQPPIYYRLGESNGYQPPSLFNYIYLSGKNVNMTKIKTGDRAGHPIADRKNPKYHTLYPVMVDPDKVLRFFNDYVDPLAAQYEQGVLWRKKSDQTCNGCQYKTACDSTAKLPTSDELKQSNMIDLILMDVNTSDSDSDE